MPDRISMREGVLRGLVVAVSVMAFLGPNGTRAEAHGGGLDRYGCHNDRKAGTYHCHRGPCQGKTFASKAAMLRDTCSKGQE